MAPSKTILNNGKISVPIYDPFSISLVGEIIFEWVSFVACNGVSRLF